MLLNQLTPTKLSGKVIRSLIQIGLHKDSLEGVSTPVAIYLEAQPLAVVGLSTKQTLTGGLE